MRKLALLLLVACSSKNDAPAPTAKATDPAPAPTPKSDPAPTPSPSPTSEPPNVRTSNPPAASAGVDFTPEAKLLFRLVACSGDTPIPSTIDPAIVDRHCKDINKKLDDYRTKYVVGGKDFFSQLVPADAPKTVVYPFGGGDLISALLAFPDADEITTISLELAGDPRRIDKMDGKTLEKNLDELRTDLGGTLDVGSNTSDNLQESQDIDLPGQVSSFLLGLAATGFEPVGMRYFTLNDDGSIHYEEQSDIDAVDGQIAKNLQSSWTKPNFSPAFANVEIQYRKAGDPSAPIHVHRHFGADLGDDALTKDPRLVKHLEAKGKVTMLVKGASYLLWRDDFHVIRDYMLANLAWMVSDSTGIPPRFTEKAGMVMETYGTFDGAFLPHEQNTRDSDDFARVWRTNPHKKLPFRFGYVDVNKSPHLVVTHPKPAT